MTSTFVLGGARSGKSARALALADPWPRRTLIATAEPLDEEMTRRIDRHRVERGAGWSVIEEPVDIACAIENLDGDAGIVIVDCLTLWLSNAMHREHDVEIETARLASAVEGCAREIVLVSNEVGLGLVPETPLGREFRDAQGRLNQAVAAACDRVEFVAAGLPLVLKGGAAEAAEAARPDRFAVASPVERPHRPPGSRPSP